MQKMQPLVYSQPLSNLDVITRAYIAPTKEPGCIHGKTTK
jgi:hypothetical protein